MTLVQEAPVRVAVWGLGPHALRKILPAIRDCPAVMLAGVCSRNDAVVQSAAKEFSCEGWTNPATMLSDPLVDAVYVATPIGLHADHGRQVLKAKRHFWCEKPLAADICEVRELAALSRAQGRVLAEAFMYLYHPQFARVVELLRSGRLGTLHSISVRFGIPPLERPGFRDSPELGGGAFLDVGSYTSSAICALMPSSVPKVLAARLVTSPGRIVDSAGVAYLRYPGDVFVTLEWGTHRSYRSELDIWGSAGAVVAERIFSKPHDHVPALRIFDLHGIETVERGPAANHFVTMFDAFAGLTRDPAAAEAERLVIEERANLADLIRRHSLTA